MDSIGFLSHVNTECPLAFKHTFSLFALLFLSYFFYLYQSNLLCKPLYYFRDQMRILDKGLSFFEFVDALAFSFTLVLSLALDYYLFKLPFWLVCLVLAVYYYQRVSHRMNLALILILDAISFGIVISLRIHCYKRVMIGLRVIDEALKFVCILWAHKLLRLYKTGGIRVISTLMIFMWGLYFMKK